MFPLFFLVETLQHLIDHGCSNDTEVYERNYKQLIELKIDINCYKSIIFIKYSFKE